jgi:YD repeat-containing protein
LTKNDKRYDMANRRMASTDASGNVMRFFYGLDATTGVQRDSVAYPDGTWEVSVTDKAGRVIQKLDKRGVTAAYAYNSQWQLESID